jgi:hypothetical protein
MNKKEAKLVVAASLVKKFENDGDSLNDNELDIIYEVLNNKTSGYTKYLDQFDECGNPIDEISKNLLNEANQKL